MKLSLEKDEEILSLAKIMKSAELLGDSNTPEELDALIAKLIHAKNNARTRIDRENAKREAEAKERARKEEEERKRAHAEQVTCMDLPLDWDNLFTADERTQGIHADSISDGLIYSLANLGRVDIEYISAVTGEDYKTVICDLKGSIYQNPDTWGECFYKGWETADEYLSGNLRRKLRSAEKANKAYFGYFDENIEAIKKVMPSELDTKDIYVTLGSPWVPPSVIDDFIIHLFGEPFNWQCIEYKDLYKTIHDELTATWKIPEKNRYHHSVAVSQRYGTDKIEALHILERTLNMQSIAVKKEVKSPATKSGTALVIDKNETIEALEKQKKLIKEFQEWVWSDPERERMLKGIYEDKYACNRKRAFDGSFLKFPGMSPDVELYPYQRDAVARIILTPNTLLAHDVGAGKTYEMIAAGRELIRMGLSKKNLYVVPNNIVGQWKDIFLRMYPGAKILCVEPKSFSPKKREMILQMIRDIDYDGIIMAYSCFEQIHLSKAYNIEKLKEWKEKLDASTEGLSAVPAGLKNRIRAVEKKLAELAVTPDSNDEFSFDKLGITRLFIDEAHNFKNVPLDTQIGNVLGINSAGSERCREMMDKVQMVQKMNDGGGVVLATGTPITNSITDAFVMQQYLQSGELGMLDLQSFDAWVGMFAEQLTQFEVDVDTSSFRLATRFARFHNIPELTSLLASVADFHSVNMSSDIPRLDGYTDALISKTPEFEDYLSEISVRADRVRERLVSRKDDNMLMITTDGRKAALDMRLVDQAIPFTYQSKVARCAENVAQIYFTTSASDSVQVVFCDSSTPKSGFNVYDELKLRLINLGVPDRKIAFIHDADTESRRLALFARLRSGDIRVIVGSTFRLGLGVNIQDRLIALHHLDVPWRPADMIQREGRILRSGNMNSKVFIYRYITEGSFDAYSWQLLETKQRFIADLLSGSVTQRSGADIEDTVLDYAEVKALAVGNPLIKDRIEAANELTRYRTLQKKLVESRTKLENEKVAIPGRIANLEKDIETCRKDIDLYDEWKKLNPQPEKNAEKKRELEKRKALRNMIGAELRNGILEPKEKMLTTYHGFDIILPANMYPEKPYLLLCRTGRYKVEMGDTDIGILIRIDNFLDTLKTYLVELQKSVQGLKEREGDIEAELSKDECYADKIEEYRGKVILLDQKLGIKNE